MITRPIACPAPAADTIGNCLLQRLSAPDYALLQPHLDGWAGERDDVLHEPGKDIEFVYFPCHEAMASFRIVLGDGNIVEAGLIGREGAVGGIVSNGSMPAFSRGIVQFAGMFYRMPLAELDRIKAESAGVRNLFSRYAECLLAQIFQSAACNATHSIEQRSAKWLVSALTRTKGDRVPLTQEQLGALLGVGRSYVARVLARFRAEEIIMTRRGHLLIRDQDRLARTACQCDDAVRAHFVKVLDGLYAKTAEEG
ncbi:MAG: Crp/Fnr family transcriptional regulator [Proteobacteria bacterium]|nr:Crp/Fnr family transcriptional regulator [Pseudomonadota bacterium]